MSERHYLTACAIIRDEPQLAEWIAYQFAIGFDHVHIFDNESVTPVVDTLSSWIRDGRVSVEVIKGRKKQCKCYTRFVRSNSSKWVAFVDCDEFIVPHDCDDLKVLLAQYEEFGGLGVTWKVFGSNGHVERPPGLVIESYTKTSVGFINVRPDSKQRLPQYKTIAQPEYAKSFPNPHFAKYRGERFAVNEKGERMALHSHSPGCVDRIQINHYFVKSLQDFKEKQRRRGPNSNRARNHGEWKHTERHCNKVTDERILRFAPRVKELLGQYGEQSLNGGDVAVQIPSHSIE